MKISFSKTPKILSFLKKLKSGQKSQPQKSSLLPKYKTLLTFFVKIP